MYTFILQRKAENLQELLSGFHECLKLVRTQDNKIISDSCFIVFFIHPRTNACVHMTFRLPWSLIYHLPYYVEVDIFFHLQPYYLKFSVESTPSSILNLFLTPPQIYHSGMYAYIQILTMTSLLFKIFTFIFPTPCMS